MTSLLAAIRKRLNAKILIALSGCVAMVMGGVIYLAIASQRQHLQEQMTVFGRELQSVAYAALRHPMAQGDSDSVERQLIEIRDRLEKDEILICDYKQEIVFATHAERMGVPVADISNNQSMLAALNRLLATGEVPEQTFFEEELDGHRYLITMQGLANRPECHHCHGGSREMLGCLITRQSTDDTYAAIAALRDRTIAISVFGIAALVVLTSLLLSRLVIRPVEELADKTRRIAAGDLDAAVAVQSDDAIGVLGRNFNAMATSVKDQIGYFNSLRAAIAAPLFIVDTAMVVTYMNDACAKLVGYSREEVEGRLTCREVFRSDRCDTTCPLRYCLEDGSTVEGITATITNRAGEKIPVMTSASALKDTQGTVIGAVEVCKDISDLLEAERLRYIQETADREEQQRHYLEERVRELLGVLSQAAEGNLQARAAIRDRNDVMDQIARHINLSLDDIEKLYARISSFNKELEREVDKRTLMLREKTVLLERANRELRELDKLKSAFLANMSHELRTPMNSIIGYTDLLLDRVDGELNEEQDKSLRKVQHNAQHLLQLINDILDMAKIESGKIALDLTTVDIRTLTESVATIFEPPITKKGLSLTLDFAPELPSVYVDEDKVRQIFINLLSNAIKFTERGGITIAIRPLPQPEQKGEPLPFVEVCVTDTGIGIKAEDLGKLFDKFSQIDSSTVRRYEGTGLGLSIARGLVVLHKGKIWVSSVPGKGTTFCFTLPTDRSLLEQPGRAEIEPMIAEVLAQYFERPTTTFLQEPRYGGRAIRCWEFTHCGQTSCPAYGNEEHRCWLIPGTHCKGTKVAACSEKIDFCKSCEMIERVIFAEAEALAVSAADAGQDADAASGRRTVLVIDDNPEVIDLVQKYIGSEYEVVGLLSGHEAVARAMEIHPVAITLDIMMPGKDGWQVLYDLKQNPATQDIPVIVLSIVDNKKLGFSLGAAEYLVKPINRELLLHKLHSLKRIAAIETILVVDTDRRTVETICRLLTESGYHPVAAHSHEEAVAAIEGAPPDLIVLNPMMPPPDGFDIIERIKTDERTRRTPLILITREKLTKEDLESFNGRIRAIFDKGYLAEDALLDELVETIKRCNR